MTGNKLDWTWFSELESLWITQLVHLEKIKELYHKHWLDHYSRYVVWKICYLTNISILTNMVTCLSMWMPKPFMGIKWTIKNNILVFCYLLAKRCDVFCLSEIGFSISINSCVLESFLYTYIICRPIIR